MAIDLERHGVRLTLVESSIDDTIVDLLLAELTPGTAYPIRVLQARYVELEGSGRPVETSAFGRALARKPGWRRGRVRIDGVLTRVGGITAGATD